MFDIIEKIQRLVACDLPNPFEVLGPQQVMTGKGNRLAIRAFEPRAREIHIVDARDRKKQYAMKKIFEPPVFEYIFEDECEPFSYQLRAVYDNGHEKFSEILIALEIGSTMKIFTYLGWVTITAFTRS